MYVCHVHVRYIHLSYIQHIYANLYVHIICACFQYESSKVCHMQKSWSVAIYVIYHIYIYIFHYQNEIAHSHQSHTHTF